jgi:hypothetical protein
MVARRVSNLSMHPCLDQATRRRIADAVRAARAQGLSARGCSSPDLQQIHQRFPAAEAVDREVPQVHGQYRVGTETLGQCDQREIREIRVDIAILCRELFHPDEVRGFEVMDRNGTAREPFD